MKDQQRIQAPVAAGSVDAIPRLALHATEARFVRVNGKLTELDRRIRAVETLPEETEEVEEVKEDGADPGERGPNKLSEAALGEWMDRTASAEPTNREWSSAAEVQLIEGLPALPEIGLDRVECGQRFCRADFTADAENLMDLMSDLLSLPAFENESFTVFGDDGAVSVYFTAPGVSINALRSEAWDDVQGSEI